MDALYAVLFLAIVVAGAFLLVWAFAPGAISLAFGREKKR